MKPVIGMSVAAVALMIALPAHGLTVLPETNATVLANALLGPGVTLVGTPTLSGDALQSGKFSGGTASVGFASGVVLSTGDVSKIPGGNPASGSFESLSSNSIGAYDTLNVSFGRPGYSPLGSDTRDASVLSFQFQFNGGVGGNIGVKYVFGSEEYINFVNSPYHDVFAFFLDGKNIALTPDEQAVSVNTINPTSNPSLYINNVATLDYSAAGLDIGFDGLTTVLTAQAFGLAAGTHTMTFVVADTSDWLLDSGVFIQAGSFSPDSVKPVQESGTMILLGSGLVGLVGYRRMKRMM